VWRIGKAQTMEITANTIKLAMFWKNGSLVVLVFIADQFP
jgi:hypothetical protein